MRFDFQYISDSLWGIKSSQKEQFASWNRFRGTVDIDFGALAGQYGLYYTDVDVSLRFKPIPGSEDASAGIIGTRWPKALMLSAICLI